MCHSRVTEQIYRVSRELHARYEQIFEALDLLYIDLDLPTVEAVDLSSIAIDLPSYHQFYDSI